jgi:hypothetical protein
VNPDGANLLAQLRDIHAAPQVPWWPPAPGWWLLGLLLLAGLAILAWRLWRRWRVHSRRRRLIRRLDELRADLDPRARPQEYLSAINQVLKVVAIRAFPGEQCARMRGSTWTSFLAERLALASPAAIEALAEGPYRMAPACDSEALDRLAREWIRRHG